MSAHRKTLGSQGKQPIGKHVFEDEEWQTLKVLSGLPDDAREDVEQVVHFLAKRPPLEKHPLSEIPAARKNIPKTIKSSSRALSDVDTLIGSGVHFLWRPLKVGPQNDASAVGVKHEILQLRDSMARIKSDLEYSETRLRYAPQGRPREHKAIAIHELDRIVFEATGRHLDQKKRSRDDGVWLSEFAYQVFRKANPELEVHTITNLIKEEQSLRLHGSRRRKRKSGNK